MNYDDEVAFLLDQKDKRIAELNRINRVLLFTLQELNYPVALLKEDLKQREEIK